MEQIEISFDECQALTDRIESSSLDTADKFIIKRIISAYLGFAKTLKEKNISLSRLREIAFGQKPRKSYGMKSKDSKIYNSTTPANKGRNPEASYTGAKKVTVKHDVLQAGGNCPTLCGGKVYPFKPQEKIHISGGAIADAVLYQLERLRCNLCGQLFTAKLPNGICNNKYHSSFITNLAIQRYLLGTPFYRIERLQQYLGIPLPDSTQWDIMASLANTLMPIYNLLLLNAANAPKLSIDDTRVKILSIIAENKDKPKNQRRGMQTNGLIAQYKDKTIVLYQSGTMSSGKRLRELLEKRISEDKFILMSDAASCNNLKGFSNIIHANCLSHARRKFSEIEDVYPEEAQIVIDAIALVYRFDTQCQSQQLTDEERLFYHQKNSSPIMALIHQWLRLLIENSLVDENNSLGQACKYALTHWDKLCRFMEVPGCNLDNNMLERFLKIPIRQRKNSLFFKTENGAQVGSIITSVLTTAIENNANPMHYLSAVIDNQDQILKEPQAWLPWNYNNSCSLSKKAA